MVFLWNFQATTAPPKKNNEQEGPQFTLNLLPALKEP
jgi:hypothetical protein